MKISLIGGTGKEGRGLARRWAIAGHEIFIGSRDPERGERDAQELGANLGREVAGGSNEAAAAFGEIVVLAVPYGAHRATLESLAGALEGKLLLDITVPLRPPAVRSVHLPEGEAAALEAAQILGGRTRVVAALHHVGAAHLADPDTKIECDGLVCGDDAQARALVIELIGDLGIRGLDAGELRNAIALEALTPVLLHLNRRYGARGAGLRITGLDPDAG
ncbi:MAG: NADPH-dependent F420 reductase [Myxococcales bacterium]|nr:NADPH-dependent F420 reductase [Myxococcales bacterium]